MNTRPTNLRRALLAAVALAPWIGPARAQALRPGADYSVLNPAQPVETAGRIEVLEFFWYGCPACYQIEPLIEAWVPKLAPDTQLRRVPAAFNERWEIDAAIYYALEAMGVLEKLHRLLFDAIHRDRLRTDQWPALRQWLEKQGASPSKFEETYKSFGVQAKIRRAKQLGAAYQIEGTPTLAVHGRYTVRIEQAQTFERMISIAGELVNMTRRSSPAKKT